MENEQHHYELRSRSRSRSHTPLIMNRSLQEQEAIEHHYDLRNKSRERSHTPGEVTSSRRSGSRSVPGSSTKIHDKSMETIEESKEGSVTGSITDNQSTKSESSNVTIRKERRSERQRAKRQLLANGQNESKGDRSDKITEQKHKNVTPSRLITSDYSSEEGEREEQVSSRPGSAYEIYKQAGEWWNVFPKTDYTYSKASQCRYEIAPGILAMPNMSRRSIHSDTDSSTEISNKTLSQTVQKTGSKISDSDTVDLKDKTLAHLSENIYDMSHLPSSSTARSTVHKRTHVEQYSSYKKIIYSEPNYSEFWPRYLSSPKSLQFTERYGASSADSDTELDENLTSSAAITNNTWRIVRWFTYVTTFIALWSRKTIEFFKFGRDKKTQYYNASHASYNESKWRAFWQSLDRYTHNIYFFFVRILVLDAWLLSQFTGVRKWLQEKCPKILLITLLPLLLLFGLWLAAQYMSFIPNVEIMSETVTEKILPAIWDNQKNEHIEEKLVNKNIPKDDSNREITDLIGKIEMLEKGQTYQMEYLMNITRSLEQQSDVGSSKEYNDKIANEQNKLDVSELNIVHTELKVIKNEFEKLRELYLKVKTCCNANAEAIAGQNIEEHVEKILLSYLPSGISKEDLTKIGQNLFSSYLSKEDQVVSNRNDDIGDVHELDEHIRKVVKEVLRIYDADKTGQVDYALESAGGQVLSTRCTQKYDIKSKAFSLFGFPLYYESSNPRTVIQGHPLQPGACWAFQDFPGYLVIQLRSIIYVTGFTMEHVSKLILPNENMSSAPKRFEVWGLTSENDPEPVLLGDYEFARSDENLQYFPVQNTAINRPYEYVELKIHSNHGQLDYTCLYRFRVHGRPA